MSMEQAVTYTWLTQVVFRMLPYSFDTEVLATVRSGNIAYEMCRPLDLYFIWYCRLLALRIVPTVLSGVSLYIIAVILPGNLGASLPISPPAGIAWLASTLAALLLGCAISNFITVSALWTVTGDGMQRILPALVMILSGSIVPLAFFPECMQSVLRILPFSGLMDIPFRFYLGLLPVSQIWSYLLLQLTWTAVFIVIGLVLTAAATKRVVIQGG
jgi:ABC-2 type transport system permease protein